MADTVQYGDPGVVDWWKDRLRGSGQFSYDPVGYLGRMASAPYQSPWPSGGGGGGLLDWLAGQGIVTGGSAYQTPVSYSPPHSMQLGDDVGGGSILDRLASQGIVTGGSAYQPPAVGGSGGGPTSPYDPSVIYRGTRAPATTQPATATPAPGQVSGHFDQRAPGDVRYTDGAKGIGFNYQPPAGAPAGGGRFEFTYDNIRDLERGLKEAGYTGQTIVKDGDVIRRDGQGRILSITRGGAGKGTSRIGWGQPTKAQRNRWRNAGGTSWDSQSSSSRSSSRYVDRNKPAYPDWIKTMSNWRGI